MATDITIPDMGESVSEGVIARWFKEDGDSVEADEPILELETDKASMELPSEVAGRLEVVVPQGETVTSGTVVARVHPSDEKVPPKETKKQEEREPAGEAKRTGAARTTPAAEREKEEPKKAADSPPLSPAVRRLVEEHELDPASIEGTGKGGRLLKEDVLRHLEEPARPEVKENHQEAPKKEEPLPPAEPSARKETGPKPAPETAEGRETERVPMTTLRRRIAERLVEAQQQAAILTTFNDVDCSAVLALRKGYREQFERKHGVDLGFMSLFGKACISAMAEVPEVNAEIDGTDIVYHRRVHLGIAVSTERGLVVPVVPNADRLSLAELERSIDDLGRRARDRKISPDELTGGTFSITNGGVFGSMLSTPLLNPPQSAILGMHRIEERPVVRDGAVVIRPMMYLALSYDHRLIDGREAVTYLRHVKQRLEDPARMILEV